MICGSKDPFQNRKEIDRAIVKFWMNDQKWTKEKIIEVFFNQRFCRFNDEYKQFIGL